MIRPRTLSELMAENHVAREPITKAAIIERVMQMRCADAAQSDETVGETERQNLLHGIKSGLIGTGLFIGIIIMAVAFPAVKESLILVLAVGVVVFVAVHAFGDVPDGDANAEEPAE